MKASENSANDLLAGAVLRSGAFESILGNLPTIGQGRVKSKQKSKPVGEVDELRIENRRKKRLREYDRLLKNFKYSAALDSVLTKVGDTQLAFYKVNFLWFLCYCLVASTSHHDVFSYSRTHPSRWPSDSARRT